MKVVLKDIPAMTAVKWVTHGDHPSVVDYETAFKAGFKGQGVKLADIALIKAHVGSAGLIQREDGVWEAVKSGDFIVETKPDVWEAFTEEEFNTYFKLAPDISTAVSFAIPPENPYSRVTSDKAKSIMDSRGYSVTGYVLASNTGENLALVSNQAVRWTTPDELFKFIFPDSNYVTVHKSVLENLENVGKQCADSGTCHHNCESVCSRKTTCVPLSIAKPWLNDDWTSK